MLQGQLAIGAAQLVVGGIGADTQHLVGRLEVVVAQVEQRVDLRGLHLHPLCALTERGDLLLRQASVGLRNHHEEVEQLQAPAVVYVAGDVHAALANGLPIAVVALLLGLVEEPAQNLVALLRCHLAEVSPQHLAHGLHL